MIAFKAIVTQQATIRIVGKNPLDYEKNATMASFKRCTEGVSQMSRIYTLTSYKFLLGLLVSVIVMAGVFDAQETHAQTPVPAPSISGKIVPVFQSFPASLDDVAVDDLEGEDCYFSNEAQCHLNAPNEFDSEVIEEAPPETDSEDDWATLLTFTCTDKTCEDCNRLTFTNSPRIGGFKSCSWESEEPEDYCDQVAELLITTLQTSQASEEAKSNAIKSAMSMVAAKNLADVELQISELKAAHQREINQLQTQLLSANHQAESIAQIKSWLRPIYTNQNRNYRQLQELAADLAEQTKQPVMEFSKLETPDLDRSNLIASRQQLPSSAKMASKLLAEQRDAEIARLKHELEVIDARLARMVVKPLQRASHLEPVYVPKGQLVPLTDKPNRHSLDKLQPVQRIRKVR